MPSTESHAAGTQTVSMPHKQFPLPSKKGKDARIRHLKGLLGLLSIVPGSILCPLLLALSQSAPNDLLLQLLLLCLQLSLTQLELLCHVLRVPLMLERSALRN